MPTLPPWATALLLRAALVAAIMAAGAFAWHRTPIIGPHAVQARLAESRDTWKKTARDFEAAAKAYKASFRLSEQLREREAGQAITAVDQEARSCAARVAEARRAASAIRTITRQEPPRDANDCPLRSLVPADRLRDALQPPR